MAGPSESMTSVCPSCRHESVVYAASQSRWLACPKCKAYYEAGSKKISQNLPSKNMPLFNIGQEGVLDGIKWKIIAFAYRKEAKGPYYWSEYTIFNPYHGYRTLSMFNGHWILVQQSDLAFAWNSRATNIEVNGTVYYKYNHYRTRTVSAIGEFTIDITRETEAFEYIAPPRMIIVEKDEHDLTFLEAKHIEPSDVARAFSPLAAMPYRDGVGAIQVRKTRGNPQVLKLLSWIFIGLLVITSFIFVFQARSEPVFAQDFELPKNEAHPAVATRTFHLPAWSQNAVFQLNAPLNNTWISASVLLVNTNTKQEWAFETGCEYYSGVDAGYSWSEGSPYAEKMISGLPAGDYTATISFMRDSTQVSLATIPADMSIDSISTMLRQRYEYKPESCTVRIYRNVPMWQNFFIMFLLIATYPLVVLTRLGIMERKRWMNSDYTRPSGIGFGGLFKLTKQKND